MFSSQVPMSHSEVPLQAGYRESATAMRDTLVGWGTPLRPKKSVTVAVRGKRVAGETGCCDTANQLAKRRRALLESNSRRDNQPKTRPDDERGEGALPSPYFHRMDRFPHGSENSAAGGGVGPEALFKLRRREVAERGVAKGAKGDGEGGQSAMTRRHSRNEHGIPANAVTQDLRGNLP